MTSGGDTIAAIATAPGRAGVAVVRVSGPDAFDIARAMSDAEPVPGRFAFAFFRDPSRMDEGRIDSGLLLAFKSPHSYTGEDVVEFQCHGGSVTPRRVLDAAVSAGARPARRGEFTLRAFLNGKLSLDAAESVLDLVDAKTDRAADDALAGLAGGRMREVRAIYDSIVALASQVEHALDIDEGELPAGFTASAARNLESIASSIDASLVRLREGSLLREGALVVIAGAPNAGKSSLLNALAGESRAIVSDVPGTTRDSIETWLDIEGFPVRLVDTAGLRDTGDAIEAEGVRRAEDLMAKADLVVMLDPEAGPAAKVMPIQPKSDLVKDSGRGPLRVSSRTGEGLAALRHEIAERLSGNAGRPSGIQDGDVSSSADAAARRRFSTALLAARAALPADATDLVLAGNAIRRAAAPLGELLGATYSDDLLDAVFSRFCVGK